MPGPRDRTAKIDPAKVEFHYLSPKCDVREFFCGYTVIEHYLKVLAQGEHNAMRSRVTTAHLHKADAVAGFFALMPESEREDFFIKDRGFWDYFRGSLINRRLYVIRLQWLAIKTELQRQKLGTLLMGRVIDDFYEVTIRTGIAALTVTPISQQATDFYSSLGFIPYSGGGGQYASMYLPAEAVIQARKDAASIDTGN